MPREGGGDRSTRLVVLGRGGELLLAGRFGERRAGVRSDVVVVLGRAVTLLACFMTSAFLVPASKGRQPKPLFRAGQPAILEFISNVLDIARE